MKEEFDIEALVPKNLRSFVSEKRENGMFLSDYQIEVLNRYGFSYQKYSKMKDLLFDIYDYLNSSYDDDTDSLSQIATELSEREYYSHTNK